MIILSLFDGLSGGLISLKELGIKVDKYFASEIKKHAILTAKHNFKDDITHVGDVTKVSFKNGILYTENGNFEVGKIDLLIGGSPCKNFSFINKHDRSGLKGEKSKLFFEYLRILEEVKPKYFMLENVASMKNYDRDFITNKLRCSYIHIDSALITAQTRNRYYWTNIKVEQPQYKDVKLKDIIDFEIGPEEVWSNKKLEFIKEKAKGMYASIDGEKSIPITARGYQSWNTQFVTCKYGIRDLTLKEYKKLQTIPEWYEFPISKSKATDLIGDGWTIDVIKHIFKGIGIENDVTYQQTLF